MDISKQLHEYEVEYHVLKEESNVPHADIETLQRVEAENRHLTEQLEVKPIIYYIKFTHKKEGFPS